MDFETLHGPYIDAQSPSVAAQIRWLSEKHHIPMEIIDKALLTVYDEIYRGKKFEPQGELTAGGMLDRYLLATAQDLLWKSYEAHHEQLSRFLQSMRDQWTAEQAAKKPSIWKRIFGRA